MIGMYMAQQRVCHELKIHISEVKCRPLRWRFGAYFTVDLHAVKFFDGEATGANKIPG